MGGLRSLGRRINEAVTGTRNPAADPRLLQDPNQVSWDPETGRPIGLPGPPGAPVARAYQEKANMLADQRRAARYNDAMNFLRQGAHLTESYRPGGLGALQSGIYGDLSRTSLALGDRVEAPDLLAGWRDEEAYKARKAARRGQMISLAGQIGGSLIGAAAGALGGPAAAGAMQGNSGSPIGTPVGGGGNYQLGPGIGNPGVGYGGQTPYQVGQGQQGPFAGGYNQPGTANAQGGPAPGQTGWEGFQGLPPYQAPQNMQQGAEQGPTAEGGAGGAQPQQQQQQRQMGGMQQPDQGGFDAYGLALIQHYHATNDHFDDGIDMAIRQMTADLMGAF